MVTELIADDVIGGEPLSFYVVYRNPRDFPGKFVVRRQDVLPDGVIAKFALPEAVVDTLEAARAVIPPGLVCVPRDLKDEPQIVESWV